MRQKIDAIGGESQSALSLWQQAFGRLARLPRELVRRAAAGLGSLAAGIGLAAMLSVGSAGSAGAAEPGGNSRPPNVVVVFTDDQGYADVGCFGAKGFKTPNIDRMSAEGVRFTSFYVGAPVCTPSRAALLTGCYPARLGLAKGVLKPQSRTGLNPDEITLAEILKTRGYATACIGKWHLGHREKFLPTKQGFDRYYGIPYSNDMRPACLLRGEETIEKQTDNSTLTKRYTQEALKFITEVKDRPFFLYLAHSMPHFPLGATPEFKGKSALGFYGDVIQEIDWSVGQVLEKLKKLGLDERTLVVFTSDNGPWLIKGKHAGSALPLRDGKGTVWEGGMREPFVARWPGKIPQGTACSELATAMDLYTTIAGLAGAKVPKDRTVDGKDIWPLLSGGAGAKSPHEAFFYYRKNGNLGAVRQGKWKLHLPGTLVTSVKSPKGGKKRGRKSTSIEKTMLYDLEADIGEKQDLAEKQPDMVAKLKALAEKFNAGVNKTKRPVGQL